MSKGNQCQRVNFCPQQGIGKRTQFAGKHVPYINHSPIRVETSFITSKTLRIFLRIILFKLRIRRSHDPHITLISGGCTR